MSSTESLSVAEQMAASQPPGVGGGADPSGPLAGYHAEQASAETAVAELERRIRGIEAARLTTFVVAALLILLRDELPLPSGLSVAAATALLVAFAGLVMRHRGLRLSLRRARARRALARMGSCRIERDWAGLAESLGEVGYHDPLFDAPSPNAESHPYLTDLSLFGPASVRALLGPTPTPTGVEALRGWLSSPAQVEEVLRRQDAVRALAADAEGRERLAVEALLVDRVDREGWAAFLDWAGRPELFGGEASDGPALPRRAAAVAVVLPTVTLAIFGAWLAGIVPGAWSWVLPLAVQSTLAWRWGRELGPYFDRASGRSPGLRRHHPLFLAWESYDTSGSRTLAQIQGRLVDEGGESASAAIRVLERWLDAVDSRASMLYPMLAATLLWDVHVAAGLERWRARTGRHVARWFDALGELEALSALATLAHDQPEWCFPSLEEDGGARLEAVGLGHPLLADTVRRISDVSLPGPGGFLLVTGSNMSGKSTLLRSLGLAAVLGQAGSVVCAKRAELSPLRTFTSMTIHDSLTEGVSLFMAELIRLKALVESADAAPPAPPLLYLIDEVLQGTNSEERRVAARRIVRHLLGSNTIGAVTTHDLALHDDPVLDPAARKVHFREEVGSGGDRILTFDYLLRPGLATSRNALKLLDVVGLGEQVAD